MLRGADLDKGVSQGELLFGHECNVELYRSAGGRVAQTLPVDWNCMPCVLHLHVIPRFEGSREVGGMHGEEEEQRREPVV